MVGCSGTLSERWHILRSSFVSSMRYQRCSVELFDIECTCFGYECCAQSGIYYDMFDVEVMWTVMFELYVCWILFRLICLRIRRLIMLWCYRWCWKRQRIRIFRFIIDLGRFAAILSRTFSCSRMNTTSMPSVLLFYNFLLGTSSRNML